MDMGVLRISVLERYLRPLVAHDGSFSISRIRVGSGSCVGSLSGMVSWELRIAMRQFWRWERGRWASAFSRRMEGGRLLGFGVGGSKEGKEEGGWVGCILVGGWRRGLCSVYNVIGERIRIVGLR